MDKGKTPRRVWSKAEEDAFLTILEELVALGKRADNGTFKPGSNSIIEQRLKELCPGCGLKATPHIESKMKTTKKEFYAVADLVGQSGFGWNDTLHCVDVEDDVWNEYLKKDPNAKGLRNKPFPHFHRLAAIFGKDRANGGTTETPGQVEESILGDEYIDLSEGNTQAQTSNCQSTQPTSSGQSRRKRSRDRDTFANAMSEMRVMMEGCTDTISERMSEVANRIGHAKDISNDRRKLLDEIKKMTHVSDEDRIVVVMKMGTRPDLIDFFFSASDGDKARMVARLLHEGR